MVTLMAERLSKEEWLAHGLQTLARAGAGALKADSLAKALGVSRGSFYWHFKDLAAFHAALLDAWRDQATGSVIQRLERAPDDGRRLERLMRVAFSGDLAVERGMRAWATHDAAAARVVAEVDARRIGYLDRLLRDNRVPAATARTRAVFLYWAFLGHALAPDAAEQALGEREIDALAALLMS